MTPGGRAFRDILIALDGSRHAEFALAHAVGLARAGAARLTLMSVAATLPAAGFALAGSLVVTVLHEAEAAAEAVLHRARRLVPRDVEVATVVKRGQPVGRAVLDEIRDGAHDLVVVGSRRHDGLRSAPLGSVSHDLLHHSPVPVLVVYDPRRSRYPF